MSAASLPSTASDDLSTRLAALSAQATPGPWLAERAGDTIWIGRDRENGKVDEIVSSIAIDADYTHEALSRKNADADFLVDVVNAVRSGALVPAPTGAARGLAVTEVDPSEQTQRYHKRPFTAFATRDEKRRKQIVTLPMDVILAVVRERLEYLGENYDPDAVTQNVACEIERAMGVFPNLEAALRTSPPETVGGGDDRLKLEWREGHPASPWADEWFIAETVYGDRVVLRSLPEEWTYDFKTADETYIAADRVKRWMQFPDSEYIAPETALSSAPPAEETWQAIETAPKDGTKVLLRFAPPFSDTSHDGVVLGQWSHDRWWLSSIWAATVAHDEPTHWQPAPLPPAPAGEAK